MLRRGRPPLSDEPCKRISTMLTPTHMTHIDRIRKTWDLGGAPVSTIVRKALEIAASVKPKR
jgi:hypothetical protein